MGYLPRCFDGIIAGLNAWVEWPLVSQLEKNNEKRRLKFVT